MKTNENCFGAPRGRRKAAKGSAFSLVEVTLALGIVSFTCVTLMGLLSVGLDLFRRATNNVVETHIAQSLASDLQLATFSNVQTITNGPFSQPAYYDGDGLKLAGNTGAVYTALLKSSTDLSTNAIYKVSAQSMSAGTGSTVVIAISTVTAPTDINYFPLIMANNHQ